MIFLVCSTNLNEWVKRCLSILKECELVTDCQIKLSHLHIEVIHNIDRLHQVCQCIPEAVFQLLIIARIRCNLIETVNHWIRALNYVKHLR